MELKTWLLYLLTDFLLIITPGPNVFLVSSQGMKYGIKPACFGSIGVAAGSLIYFALSSFGLGVFILKAGNLFDYIKLAGAIYLAYTGIIMIRKTFKPDGKESVDIAASQKNLKAFTQGFIIQTANPKTIIFFVALLPQFINAANNTTFQFIIFSITTIVLEIIILIGYGWLTSKGTKLYAQNKSFIKWQGIISGVVLIAMGLNVFSAKHP